MVQFLANDLVRLISKCSDEQPAFPGALAGNTDTLLVSKSPLFAYKNNL